LLSTIVPATKSPFHENVNSAEKTIDTSKPAFVEELPAVGLERVDSRKPPLQKDEMRRHAPQRYLQPTESWSHRGPESDGAHLHHRSPGVSFSSVAVMAKTHKETVAEFNRRAALYLKNHGR
jgi:hypothetical protein